MNQQMKSLVWRQVLAVVVVIALFAFFYVYCLPWVWSHSWFFSYQKGKLAQPVSDNIIFILSVILAGLGWLSLSGWLKRYTFVDSLVIIGLATGVLAFILYRFDNSQLRNYFAILSGLSIIVFSVMMVREIMAEWDLLTAIKPRAKVWCSFLLEFGAIYTALDIFRFFVVK